jgi:hypothetical protein
VADDFGREAVAEVQGGFHQRIMPHEHLRCTSRGLT